MDLDYKDQAGVVAAANLGIVFAFAKDLTQKGEHPALCARHMERPEVSDAPVVQEYDGKADVSQTAAPARYMSGKTYHRADISPKSISISPESQNFTRAALLPFSQCLAKKFIKYNIDLNTFDPVLIIKSNQVQWYEDGLGVE